MSGGGGKSQSTPANTTQQVTQTSEFPTELKPFITDILERAKSRAETREQEGFLAYPDPRIAGFTPEQEAAQQRAVAVANQGVSMNPTMASGATYLAPSFGNTALSTQQFGTADAARLMNPFQQNVIDIQKREAERRGDMQQQEIASQSTLGAGAFGGSRQAILEAEQMRNEAQLMNDIQAKGSQQAYDMAGQMFEAEKARQLAGGKQFAGLAQLAPTLASQEIQSLQATGAQKQTQQQAALDVGYQQFLEERQYPEQILQEYQSLVRGFPMDPNVFRTQTTTLPQPDTTSQLIGLGTAGLGAIKAFASDGGQLRNKVKKVGIATLQVGGQANSGAARYYAPFQNNIASGLEGLKGLSQQSAKEKELMALLAQRQQDISGKREKLDERQDSDMGLSIMRLGANIAGGREGSALANIAAAAPATLDEIAALRKGRKQDELSLDEQELAYLSSQLGVEGAQRDREMNLYDKTLDIGKQAADSLTDTQLAEFMSHKATSDMREKLASEEARLSEQLWANERLTEMNIDSAEKIAGMNINSAEFRQLRDLDHNKIEGVLNRLQQKESQLSAQEHAETLQIARLGHEIEIQQMNDRLQKTLQSRKYNFDSKLQNNRQAFAEKMQKDQNNFDLTLEKGRQDWANYQRVETEKFQAREAELTRDHQEEMVEIETDAKKRLDDAQREWQSIEYKNSREHESSENEKGRYQAREFKYLDTEMDIYKHKLQIAQDAKQAEEAHKRQVSLLDKQQNFAAGQAGQEYGIRQQQIGIDQQNVNLRGAELAQRAAEARARERWDAMDTEAKIKVYEAEATKLLAEAEAATGEYKMKPSEVNTLQSAISSAAGVDFKKDANGNLIFQFADEEQAERVSNALVLAIEGFKESGGDFDVALNRANMLLYGKQFGSQANSNRGLSGLPNTGGTGRPSGGMNSSGL